MLTLFEQIDKGNLWQSHGGIHPPELKKLSNTTPIQALPLAKEYWLPISGINETCTLVVTAGERVLKGQPLTKGLTKSYLPCHAPTSGIFTGIQDKVSNHASGILSAHCIIEADGKDEAIKAEAAQVSALSNQEILEKIRLSGVAGLGGAAFPSHIKLNPVSEIELVIINGVECEPYITADDRLMREQSDKILSGIEIIHRLLQPKRVVIAIEDNKPEAIEAMSLAISRSHLPANSTRVTKIPTKYPSGGEKQLIQIIAGNEVPSGSIPAHLGILVHNVATTFAIADAVREGKALTERVVTLTGEGVKNPGNFWVPIGTPVQHLLDHGLIEPDVNQVICGGPMMGHTLASTQVPIAKGSNCILVPGVNELAPEQPEKACIRCGECAQVCPAQLLPQQLFWHAKAGEYDKAASYNLRDCIECGSCSYVCPSDIPLVEYYRIAKSALRQEAEEKMQAERAKVRFEARLARLEEEKQAREAKAKQAAERRQKSMTGSDKDKVAEAMARIQAKKQAQAKDASGEQSKSETASPAKAGVAAAVARAKAKKAAQQASKAVSDEVTIAENKGSTAAQEVTAKGSKQDKIAAAIARAKAKKASQSQDANTENASSVSDPTSDVLPKTNGEPQSPLDDKKAKIAAAVARAKAKKAAQKQGSDAAETESSRLAAEEDDQAASTSTDRDAKSEDEKQSPVDDKKAKIAAAIAKAKAKKAAQHQGSQNAEITQTPKSEQAISPSKEAEGNHDTPTNEAEDKKARIAAAVARAKAKKAQKLSQGDS